MRLFLSLLTVSPLFTSSAFGWGCEGHQMIALIARAHLTQQASNEVDRLLRENPIDPALTRFCKDRPRDLMADAGTWADDARTIGKTADWHFIDIPLAIESGDVAKWCKPAPGGKPGCVVTAIEYEWAILRDLSQPASLRASALRYVIHFFGDLSQPLHASDNRDRGGNCTEIRFFSEGKPRNLHAIWDYELIEHELQAANTTQIPYAAKLDESFIGHWQEWGESRTDVVAWAWESHKFAQTVAYGELKPEIPIEPAAAGTADQDGCNAERNKVAALHISIDDEYANRAMPVIRQQLAKAAYRLAGLLNQTFR
jgi:hypothetical protein